MRSLCWIGLLSAAISLASMAADPGEELRRAAGRGDVAAVKALLDSGAAVDAANSYGATALTFAADKGHIEVARLLLERGADPNRKDTFYDSSIPAWAAYNGHAEVVRLLLAHGAGDVKEILGGAVFRGHEEVVKAVLESGKADPEALSGALAQATQAEQPEIAEMLKAAGAVPPAAAADKVAPEVLASYAGAYKGDEGGDFSVAFDGDRLILNVPGQGPTELSAADERTFHPIGMDQVTVTFLVDGDQVIGLKVQPPPEGQVYRRLPAAPAATGEPKKEDGQ